MSFIADAPAFAPDYLLSNGSLIRFLDKTACALQKFAKRAIEFFQTCGLRRTADYPDQIARFQRLPDFSARSLCNFKQPVTLSRPPADTIALHRFSQFFRCDKCRPHCALSATLRSTLPGPEYAELQQRMAQHLAVIKNAGKFGGRQALSARQHFRVLGFGFWGLGLVNEFQNPIPKTLKTKLVSVCGGPASGDAQ
jgi:hypothetical protein